MNHIQKIAALTCLAVTALAGCSKNNDLAPTQSHAANGAIKAKLPGGLLFGFAVNYQQMASDEKYAATVAQEANTVTFENELKYGSVVQNDGSFNFTTADALYNLCAGAGLKVFGHNLVWSQQQNTVYLTSIAGGTTSAKNQLENGGFEAWANAAGAPDGHTFANGQTNFSKATDAANVHSGKNAIAVSGYGAAGGSGWRVQLVMPVQTVPGHKYTISFWAKGSQPGASGGPSSAPGCYWQGEWDNGGGNTQYTGDQPITSTGWAKYDMKFNGSSVSPAATAATTKISFDMGTIATGQMVWIDDVVVNDFTQDSIDAANNASAGAVAGRLDSVLQLWIHTAVAHYAGKINAWDVLNEILADDGSIRNNKNTAAGTGVFVWTEYLGKTIGVTSFKAARQANPDATLFINDYGLESNNRKLDSLIAYVKWLKDQGAPVDGIGTQMHITISTAKDGIDNMFRKLAATGLKIRISELDVAVNNVTGFVLTPQVMAFQRIKYQEAVASFMRNVPAAQRYGITIWGVDDPHSWRYKNGNDFPLLFDSAYVKKTAYDGVLQGLKN